jgi:hypothetical protein
MPALSRTMTIERVKTGPDNQGWCDEK